MKKRAQLPDAYTFTILFRGLSWYPQFSKSTSRALSIYQSMFADNSPVRPSIIHTNAVLKVCALGRDVDALLGIAAGLPRHGSRAPNNLTFTIILNALRSKAFEETKWQKATSEEEDTSNNEITALAVQQGRRLWVEVRERWMSGDVHLDEEFVCAMGRLLLLGSEAQDHDDVLSLLEQTMSIPRQIARAEGPARRRAAKAPGPSELLELPPFSPDSSKLKTLPLKSKEEHDILEPHSNPFAPLPKAAGPTQSAVLPGRNTLSLVLDACIRLKYVRAAQNYWGILTSPDGYHKISPDSENYHMYLRLLRLQRSARLAVELVEEMRSVALAGNAGAVQTKTFRIALSCCVRDIKNRNSILYAGKLVRMMTDTLPYPDAKALSMYLKLALGQKPRDWRVIMGVIRGTELGVRNLRSLLAYDPAGRQKQNEEDILELVRGLVGAFDVVLDLGNEEINSAERNRCREQRHSLAAYLTRTYNPLMAEGEISNASKGEDEGTGEKVTFQKKIASGRRNVARRSADEGPVGSGKGEWTRERKWRGRVQMLEKKDGVRKGRERGDGMRAWRSRGGRNEERVERYKAL